MSRYVSELVERSILCVRGEDWRSFLQGLITQDVETLNPGDLRYAAFLAPQGKLLADLFVFGLTDGCYLDVSTNAAQDLQQRLSMYKLRSRVEIVSLPVRVRVRWGECLPEQGWAADPRHPALGQRAYGENFEDVDLVPPSVWHAHRFELGIAELTEAGSGEHYPVELNLDLLNGIDFHKGCFVGQETTSRMKRRGQIKSRVLPLVLSTPAQVSRGDEILNGTMRAGQVIGVVGHRALGLMRLDRLEGPLETVSGPVVVTWPDWIKNPA